METSSPSPKYVAVLALIAGVILVGGWFARPGPLPESPPPAPSQTELEQLAQRAERRSIESTAQFFADLARDAAAALAYQRETDGTAVIWTPTSAVSAPVPTSIRSVTLVTGAGSFRASPELRSADLPLAALAIAPDHNPVPARHAQTAPSPGNPVTAVWRTKNGHAFARGNAAAVSPAHCGPIEVGEIQAGVDLTRAMLGGGLFDLDGQLVAVILPCGDRIAAVDLAGVQAALDREVTVPERLQARYGAVLTPIPDQDRDVFTATGVLVREVGEESAVAEAGLMVGDVIIAADDRDIASVDDLEPLIGSDAPSALRVQRGARQVMLTLEVDPAEKAAPPGLTWSEPSPAGHTIRSVTPDSRAGRAGLQPGDRILAVNRAPLTSRAQFDRLLAAGRHAPTLLEVGRGRRRLLAVMR